MAVCSCGGQLDQFPGSDTVNPATRRPASTFLPKTIFQVALLGGNAGGEFQRGIGGDVGVANHLQWVAILDIRRQLGDIYAAGGSHFHRRIARNVDAIVLGEVEFPAIH